MNVQQAAAELSARAHRTGTRWGAVMAVGLVGMGAGTAGLILGMQTVLYGWANVKLAVLVGLAVPMLFVGPARRFVKRRVAARRGAWIEQLAKENALSLKELEKYVTLDSW